MSNSDFENIRPYLDDEVVGITSKLSETLDWVKLMSPIIGEDNAQEIAEAMSMVRLLRNFKTN